MIRDAPHPTPGCQDLLPSRPHWPPVWGRKVTTGHRQATSRRTLASPCLLSQEGPSPAAPSPPRPPPQPPTPTGAPWQAVVASWEATYPFGGNSFGAGSPSPGQPRIAQAPLSLPLSDWPSPCDVPCCIVAVGCSHTIQVTLGTPVRLCISRA